MSSSELSFDDYPSSYEDGDIPAGSVGSHSEDESEDPPSDSESDASSSPPPPKRNAKPRASPVRGRKGKPKSTPGLRLGKPKNYKKPQSQQLERDASPKRVGISAPPKTDKSMSAQWCYTLNSPERPDIKRLRHLFDQEKLKITYHIFQVERGESGTQHCQGYICFATRKRLQTVKTLLGSNPHLEVTWGTPTQASDYCRDPAKRDPDFADFLYERGELPIAVNQSGARNDLLEIQALLDAGTPIHVVAGTHFPTWTRCYKAFDLYRTQFVQKPRSSKSIMFVFFGEPGTGKSAAAHIFSRSFTVPPGSGGTAWFDGYDADCHQTVIFDEFHGGRCSWSELLRLTDRYPMTVNSKGSHLQFSPRCMVFTSNTSPESWYSSEKIPDKTPLTRRIDYQWEYWAIGSKFLHEGVAKALDVCLEKHKMTIFDIQSIMQCQKGDPTVHPHFARMIGFDVTVGKLCNVYYALRVIKEEAQPDLEDLFEDTD